MRSAAPQANRKLMVGHVERFNPVVTVVRGALKEERLGRIFRAQAIRVGPLPARIRDAGVAIDVATHDLDLLQHLLDRQVVEVYADGGRFVHSTQEDMVTCLARIGTGSNEVLGLLDVNWLTPEARREMTLVGEDGALRASFADQVVRADPHQWGGPVAAVHRAPRALARRARRLCPMRSGRNAGASYCTRRRPRAGRSACNARVRQRQAPRDPA